MRLPLTRFEYRLLAFLARRANRLVRYAEVACEMWPPGTCHVQVEGMRTHVTHLRAKLGDAKDYLKTERAMGYKLTSRRR